eukprot:UN27569
MKMKDPSSHFFQNLHNLETYFRVPILEYLVIFMPSVIHVFSQYGCLHNRKQPQCKYHVLSSKFHMQLDIVKEKRDASTV